MVPALKSKWSLPITAVAKMACILMIFISQFICFGMGYSQTYARSMQRGQEAWKKKDFAAARKEYGQALQKNPESAAASFNLADVEYAEGNLDIAASEFDRISKSKTPASIRAKAFHNLGNVKLQKKKYDEAAKAFSESLKLKPDDEDTRYNLAYAKKMLKKQEQQNKQKNDQQKNQQNKDSKNQENNQQNQNSGSQNKDQKKSDSGNNDKSSESDQQKKENDSGSSGQDEGPQPLKPQENNPGKGNPRPAQGQLSREEAERLLKALNNQEKPLHAKKAKVAKDGKPQIQSVKPW